MTGVEFPKPSGGVALSAENDAVLVVDGDIFGCEGCSAAMVAELTNGCKGSRSKFAEDVGVASARWEGW